MTDKKIFVIEHCENCQMHSWNTRHDANKYKANALGGKFITILVSPILIHTSIDGASAQCCYFLSDFTDTYAF